MIQIILIVKFIAGIVDEDDEDNPEISGGRASTFQLDTPGAGSTPAVSNNGPSWMEDIGFDPLSTVDNSAIISAQVDSIHQVIVDSAELFGTVASDQAVAAMDALRSSIHARIIIIEGEVEAGDDADRYISSNRDNDASSSMSIAEDLQLDSNETSVVSGGLRQRRMSSS